MQVALRDALSERDAEVLVRAARGEVTDRLAAAGRAAGTTYGIEVLVVVGKDVLLPPELRGVRRGGRGPAARADAARGGPCRDSRDAVAGQRREGLDEHLVLARLKLVQALPPGAKVVLDQP